MEMHRCGVSQGSILGPLLFLICVNDAADNIKSDTSAYADDTALMKVLNSDADVYMIYILFLIGLPNGG